MLANFFLWMNKKTDIGLFWQHYFCCRNQNLWGQRKRMKLCKKRSTVRNASFFIFFIFFLLNIKSEVCFPTYVWEVIGALEKGKPISVGKCEIFIYFWGLRSAFSHIFESNCRSYRKAPPQGRWIFFPMQWASSDQGHNTW